MSRGAAAPDADLRRFLDNPAQFKKDAAPESAPPPAPPQQETEIPELRRRIINRVLSTVTGHGIAFPSPSIDEQGKFGFGSEPLISRAVRSEFGQKAKGALREVLTGRTTPAGVIASSKVGRAARQEAFVTPEIVLEELMGRIAEVVGDDESAAAWLEVAVETQEELNESVEPGFAAGAGRITGVLLNPMYLLAFGLAGRAVGAPARALAARAGPLLGKVVQGAGLSAKTAQRSDALLGYAIKTGTPGAAGFGTLGGIEGFAGEGTVDGMIDGVIHGVTIGAPLGWMFGLAPVAFRALQRASKTLVEGASRRRLGLPEKGDLTAEQIGEAFKKKAAGSHPDNQLTATLLPELELSPKFLSELSPKETARIRNRRSVEITDAAGEKVASVRIKLKDDGRILEIDIVRNPFEPPLRTGQIRSLISQLGELFPEATEIRGLRVSAGRAAKVEGIGGTPERTARVPIRREAGSDAEFAKDAFAYKELMVEAKAAPKVTEPTEPPFPEKGGAEFIEKLAEGRDAALTQEAATQAAKVVPTPRVPPPAPGGPGRRGLMSLGPLQDTAAFIKRNFRSAGDLPLPLHRLIRRLEGKIRGRDKRIEVYLKNYRVAAKETYKGGQPTPVEMELLTDFLQGNVAIQAIPKRMRHVMSKFRYEIDANTAEMIRLGVASGPQLSFIAENMGVYTRRAYRIFQDPKWAEGVDQRIRNRAKAFIRNEFPNKNEAEVEGMLEELLFAGKAAKSPVAFLSSGKLGSKDLSMFKRRKDIPDEIRALWGEIKTPMELYALSVGSMGHLIENQKFLNAMKEAGTKGGWLRSPEQGPIVSEEFGPIIQKIAADESSTMSPLNGFRTSPEIAAALDRQFNTEALPTWLRTWMKVNAVVKFNKIVLDNVTQIRNWVGNTGFAVAQGHWASFGRKGIFGKSVWRTIATDMANLKGNAWRARVERLIELRVLHDSARGGELQAVLKDASKHADVNSFMNSGVLNVAKSIPVKLYSGADDFWKVMGFENEVRRYTKAKPNWSQAQVEEHAAEIISNTYPTYSLVPHAIQTLRRVPLVGPFVSFSSELFRTGFQTFKLISKEMKDPALRAIGAQRIAGVSAAVSGPAAAVAAARFMAGISREDDTDLRRFLPGYVNNHQLYHMGRNDAGEYRVIDITYNDPHGLLREPFIAFMSGGDEETVAESMQQALLGISEPFWTPELMAEAVVDVLRNKTSDGFDLYNPANDSVDKGIAVAKRLGEALKPGVFRNMERFYGAETAVNTDVYAPTYRRSTEILRNTTGVNTMTFTVQRSFERNVGRQNRMIDNARKLLSTAMSRRDTTDEELVEAYEDSEKAREAAFKVMTLDIQAAVRLGDMSLFDTQRALTRAGFSGFDTNNIAHDTYFPYTPTSRFAENVERRLMASGVDRLAVNALFRHRRDILRQAVMRKIMARDLDDQAGPPPQP